MTPFPAIGAKGLAKVEVCAVSGGLPRPWCPRTVPTWFIPGVSPIGLCDLHRRVAVDAFGNRVCDGTRPGVKTEVVEYWPSDLLSLFRLAGLPRRRPPPDEPGCPLGELAARGAPPSILSPRKNVTYTIRGADGSGARIELEAV